MNNNLEKKTETVEIANVIDPKDARHVLFALLENYDFKESSREFKAKAFATVRHLTEILKKE